MSDDYWKNVQELAAMRNDIPEDRRAMSNVRKFFAPLIEASKSASLENRISGIEKALGSKNGGVDSPMKCEHCDQEVDKEQAHYGDSVHEDAWGEPVYTPDRWHCEPMNWRKRALDAEVEIVRLKDQVRMLEGSIHDLWSTSNA